jgi:hypothetical protein
MSDDETKELTIHGTPLELFASWTILTRSPSNGELSTRALKASKEAMVKKEMCVEVCVCRGVASPSPPLPL